MSNIWDNTRLEYNQMVNILPDRMLLEDETLKFISSLIDSGNKNKGLISKMGFLEPTADNQSITLRLVRNDLYNPINWKYIIVREGNKIIFIAHTIFDDVVIFDIKEDKIMKSYERREIGRLIGHSITKYSSTGKPLEKLYMDSSGIITRNPVVDNNEFKTLFEQYVSSNTENTHQYHFSL